MLFKLFNLENMHTPVIPSTPHFFWDEVLQNDGSIPAFKDRDFNIVEDPGVMRNIIQHALMMEEYRELIGGAPISINSWYRPEIYNSVVLKENGYDSSYISDHLCTNSCATDVEVAVTTDHKEKWKQVCLNWRVHYNIVMYSWGMHLGWRTDRDSNVLDRR
jgi:hypothetical protein